MRYLQRTPLAQRIRACRNCDLCDFVQAPVPGEGPSDAEVVFVARNPGREEDAANRPLMGRAGRGPFNSILGYLGLDRKDVGIVNTVSCFTPDNRPPEIDELAACASNFSQQLMFFKHVKAIIPMGREALHRTVDLGDITITQAEGRFFKYQWDPDVLVFPVRHPAFFLRDSTAWKQFGRLVLPRIKQRLDQLLKEPEPQQT